MFVCCFLQYEMKKNSVLFVIIPSAKICCLSLKPLIDVRGVVLWQCAPESNIHGNIACGFDNCIHMFLKVVCVFNITIVDAITRASESTDCSAVRSDGLHCSDVRCSGWPQSVRVRTAGPRRLLHGHQHYRQHRVQHCVSARQQARSVTGLLHTAVLLNEGIDYRVLERIDARVILW